VYAPPNSAPQPWDTSGRPESYQSFVGQPPRNEVRQRWEKGERLNCKQLKNCKFIAVQYMHEGSPL
jgi:hypothetical protein